jgi:hypothetical protein
LLVSVWSERPMIVTPILRRRGGNLRRPTTMSPPTIVENYLFWIRDNVTL